ncbi:unnamed protein product [Nyctereutes procyonoides]|uniref:(raccoon dog) hypothetical protein n=1 Tax=Nyctereutes procyonoides TaxID=34880 RepID=A0A811Y4D9_NYCPR|nr:unnamed protein product [Nyctereutes procyonoides]
MQQYQCALFCADKLCLYLTVLYYKAVHTLHDYAARKHQQALDILDMEETINNTLFEKYLIKLQRLHACFEAFNLLMSHHMLTAQKEKNLIIVKDPFHANCLPVHTGTFVELNKTNDFFSLSHILVCNPVSWFAVGRYYLMVGHKNEHVRKPTWVAYQQLFAVESEHDQAMALNTALEDPFVMHKIAEKRFLDHEVTVDKWEPLLNNLDMSKGSLKNMPKALDYHHVNSLELISSTCSVIRYIHSPAVFSVTMLGHCIEMYIGDSEACTGADIKNKLKCYDFWDTWVAQWLSICLWLRW